MFYIYFDNRIIAVNGTLKISDDGYRWHIVHKLPSGQKLFITQHDSEAEARETLDKIFEAMEAGKTAIKLPDQRVFNL